jgi:hypothetical protein
MVYVICNGELFRGLSCIVNGEFLIASGIYKGPVRGRWISRAMYEASLTKAIWSGNKGILRVWRSLIKAV